MRERVRNTGPSPRARRPIAAGLMAAALLAAPGPSARADRGAPGPGSASPAPAPRRTAAGPEGMIGLAATAALAGVGAAVLLGAKLRPKGAGGALRVVGRAQLTGRHAVYLLRAGDRTLLVGVGPQGAPSLLGELADPGPGPAAPGVGEAEGSAEEGS